MVTPVTKQRELDTAAANADAEPIRTSQQPVTTRPVDDGFEAKANHNRLLGHVERHIVGRIDPPTIAQMVAQYRGDLAGQLADATPVAVSDKWSAGDVLLSPLRAILPFRWQRAPGGEPSLRPGGADSPWAYVEPHRWPALEINREVNTRVIEYVNAGTRAPYDVIVVPGFTTDDQEGPLSQKAKDRLAQAASDWREGSAPFIMVSGGDVHPEGTPHIEAIEMRRYLIEELGIPSDRIVVEPNARHTTTNVRNAGRYMQRMGLERASIVSSPAPLTGQSSYLQAAGRLIGGFHVRCRRELGAVIGTFERVDAMHTAFVPFDTVNLMAREPDVRDP